jgi:hypothetical protein
MQNIRCFVHDISKIDLTDLHALFKLFVTKLNTGYCEALVFQTPVYLSRPSATIVACAYSEQFREFRSPPSTRLGCVCNHRITFVAYVSAYSSNLSARTQLSIDCKRRAIYTASFSLYIQTSVHYDR